MATDKEETATSTLAQKIARTWRAERPVRWFAVDALLAAEAEHAVARREGTYRRTNPILIVLGLLAWIAPLIGLGMLVGTWAGRFDASISVPGAAVAAVVGVVADWFFFRAEREAPGEKVLSVSWLPVSSAVACFVMALLRTLSEPVDFGVAAVSLAVLFAASAALGLLMVRRRRLPRVSQSDLAESLRRNPVVEESMRKDLEGAVSIYRERGLITDEVAERALVLGPGRLAGLAPK